MSKSNPLKLSKKVVVCVTFFSSWSYFIRWSVCRTLRTMYDFFSLLWFIRSVLHPSQPSAPSTSPFDVASVPTSSCKLTSLTTSLSSLRDFVLIASWACEKCHTTIKEPSCWPCWITFIKSLWYIKMHK